MLKTCVNSFRTHVVLCWAIGLSLLMLRPVHSLGSVDLSALEVQSIDFNLPTPKVVIGEESTKTLKDGTLALKYSFLVSLVNQAGTVECGGALISRQHVLTAASCVDSRIGGIGNPIVVTGSLSGQPGTPRSEKLEVVSVMYHPDWYFARQTDLAILELATSASPKSVQLPSSGTFELREEQKLLLLGFGRITARSANTDTAQQLAVSKADHSLCEAFLAKTPTPSQICIQSQGGSCRGDKGGPIIIPRWPRYKSVLVGIVGDSNNCAETPVEIHTKVAPSLDWIKETIGHSTMEVVPRIVQDMPFDIRVG